MSELTAAYVNVGRQAKNTKNAGRIIYITLMAFCLVSYLWVLAIGAGIQNMPAIIWIARIATVPLALYYGKLWRNKGFLLLSAYTVLFFLRCFIPDPDSIFSEEVAENVLSALWLFTACYGLGFILNGKQIKTFLLICSGIWLMGITVFSCLGIYAAWTEQVIKTFGDGTIQLDVLDAAVRLSIIYLPTISGSILGISVLIIVIIFVCLQNRLSKALCVLAMIPLIFALALTDSRTAFISVPAGLAVVIFAVVYNAFQKRSQAKKVNNYTSWVFGILAMFVAFIFLVFLLLQITPLFNSIKMRGIIPVAYAEEVEKVSIANRGFSGDRILHGRAELWSSVIEHIKQNPIILLTGESKLAPLRSFDDFYAHCHCLYLQILLESGIPGLLLFLSFIIYTIVHAIKVIRTPDLPLWIRLLPALPISLWVGDIAETFTWLRSSQCPMGAIAIISAGIICAQKTKLCGDIKQINEPII